MGTNLTITAQFDNMADASEFMSRIGHPLVVSADPRPITIQPEAKAPKAPKAPKPEAAAPAAPAAPVLAATAAAPVAPAPAAVAPDAAVALVMPTAAPVSQPAAPKQPNAPVAAVANANKQPVPLHPATQDGVRAALKDVFNLRGATVATELLKKHGAVSVSTVAKEQYTNFVNACAAS